jgi:Uma2 family endonuclease
MNSATAALEAPIEQQPVETPRRLYTYDEFIAEFPETNQLCELWDGEVIFMGSPTFEHQEIVLRLYRLLYEWISARKLGKVITAPIDMVLSSHRATQPDIVFIAEDRLEIVRKVIHGPGDLAVEVISLGGRNRDRIDKRDLYEQYGIKEYWIIDPEAQTIEVLHLDNGRYRLLMRATGDQKAASSLLPGFETTANAIFTEGV